MILEVKRTYGYQLNNVYQIEIPDDSIYLMEYIDHSFEDAHPHLAIMSNVPLETSGLPCDIFEMRNMNTYIFHNLRVINDRCIGRSIISDILKEEYTDLWFKKCSKDRGTVAYIKINDIAIDKFIYSHVLRDLSVAEFRIRDTNLFSDILTMNINTPLTSSQYYYLELTDEHEINNIRRKLEGKIKYLL